MGTYYKFNTMKTPLALLVGILGLAVAISAAPGRKAFPNRGRKSYEGYKVIEVVPENEEQLQKLDKMKNNVHLDFWTEPRKIGLPVRIMVEPSVIGAMRSSLGSVDLRVTVVNHNVQESIDEERLRLENNKANMNGQAVNLEDFNKYDDIMALLEDLKAQCAPGVTCETYSIGQSIYGNDLKVLKISKPGENRTA